MKTKFLLLSAVCLFMVLTSGAQINAGKYLAGGYFNMYSAKNSQSSLNSKNQSLNVSVQVGKVTRENTVFGVIASYGYYNNHAITLQDSSFNKNNQFSAGVFYRKYKRLTKDLYFFGEVDVVYNHSENSQGYDFDGTSSKTTSDGGSASFIPGISYAVCKRLQLELLMPNIIGLSYSHEKTVYKTPAPPSQPNADGNVFSFNTNLNSNFLSSFGVGFKFLLGK